jgi:hypothetical protein
MNTYDWHCRFSRELCLCVNVTQALVASLLCYLGAALYSIVTKR